jgi:hypothetical protein
MKNYQAQVCVINRPEAAECYFGLVSTFRIQLSQHDVMVDFSSQRYDDKVINMIFISML